MISRQLRARCEALLTEVELIMPFDKREFCRRLGKRRGRPILLHGLDSAATGLPSGWWGDLADADLILYDNTTTPYHQDNIVLHEVGHVVADHYADQRLDEDVAEFMMPTIGRLQAQRQAARHDYSRQEEQEAEFFARFVLGLVRPDTGGGRSQADPQRRALLKRLDDTFGA